MQPIILLMGIQNVEQIKIHPLRGNLFETLIVTEAWKNQMNNGVVENLFFYRDSQNREIDLLQDTLSGLNLIEIKSGQTVSPDWFKTLRWGKSHLKNVNQIQLIYGGEQNHTQSGISVQSWKTNFTP